MKLRRRHGRGGGSTLDFTSLVDVALVLVVFFLLSSQALAERSLPVSLPQAGTSGDAAPQSLEVSIDAGGGISCQGRSVDIAALIALVGHLQRATLLADTQARHGRVVDVVDALRHAGVQEIYYATKPRVEDW